ncbi:MAG: DNRLRE domain-containing protein, partial [Chloroflexi bacterium]|nr:DNRLRE domain-containing protein [Chloroflexota bacterium]
MRRLVAALSIMAIVGLLLTTSLLGDSPAMAQGRLTSAASAQQGLLPASVGLTQYTVVFQEGLNDYSGAEDTGIYAFEPDRNLSGQADMRVGDKQRRAIVVKFNLAPIPSTASIVSATLEVYASGWSGVSVPISVYYITRTNAISELTWNRASASQSWGLPGCEDPVTDRRATPEVGTVIASINRWYTVDVSSVVQGWVNGSLANNGLLLRGDSAFNDGMVVFAS